MKIDKELRFKYFDKLFKIKSIDSDDVTDEYINGLKKTNFLINNPNDIDHQYQRNYITHINNSKNDVILGFYHNSILIGTSGVQNISADESAPVGIFIFNEKYRGIGLGKILVWSATHIVYKYFGVEKFWADMLETNVGSYKSFVNCGYKISRQKNGIIIVNLNIEDLITPDNISSVSFS